MKRFIYVPNKFIGTEKKIPQKALELSKETGLQIRTESENDDLNISDIEILIVPEIVKIDFSKTVEKNFINSIDYTNEFISFNNKFICKVKGKNKSYIFSPRLVEKHCLKFRFRIDTSGTYSFDIMDESGNQIVSEEYFEVL